MKNTLSHNTLRNAFIGGMLLFALVLPEGATGQQAEEMTPGARAVEAAPAEPARSAGRKDDARTAIWERYALQTHSPVFTSWISPQESGSSLADTTFPSGNVWSLTELFGGQAAIRETLQLQHLRTVQSGAAERTIPVSTLTGVTVRSHPYADMLADQAPAPELALANVVPPDRFFVYVAHPSFLLDFLDNGLEFLTNGFNLLSQEQIDYDVPRKYLARLGLDEQMLHNMLTSGGIAELALMTPDLFFMDGTDLTVILRMADRTTLLPFLPVLATMPSDGTVQRLDTDQARPAYWAVLNDLLLMSTNMQEIEIARYYCQHPEGSLGQSAEFRYMLTQLPLEASTQMFAYFSDPFIRRLVGPAVKIGQQRRVLARLLMEEIVARALLARTEGVRTELTLETLIQQGYLPASSANGDVALDDALHVRSATYGPLSDMASLLTVPMDTVTVQEAETYGQYVHAYQRYWRQYFDPIALRIDVLPEDTFEMTTFILPLIENSTYNGLRQLLANKADQRPLQIPEFSPSPTVMLSVNLKRSDALGHFLNDLMKWFGLTTEYHSDDPDSPPTLTGPIFGSAAHLAIYDADPVMAFGDGDVLSAFNAGAQLGAGGDALVIGGLFAFLTRPCTLSIEMTRPEYVRNILKYLPRVPAKEIAWSTVDMYQIEDRDEWLVAYQFLGMLNLHFGIDFQGNYLRIRNLPWSNHPALTGVRTASDNGASLQVFPSACRIQLPAIFTAVSKQYQEAAMRGIGRLYPLIVSGYATPDNVMEKHNELFGFAPVHPEGGQWRMEGEHLGSSVYGTIFRQKHPAYRPENGPVGLLKDVTQMSISMQFEDTGLRAKTRWQLSSR